jgi:glycosyltransferase involved in cell wall biosynthesis
MELSVILPVYNECNRLEDCIGKVDGYLSGVYSSYEIIVIEDSSTDNSYEIAKEVAARNNHVVLLHNDRRLGRGASLNEAIRASRSDLVMYMDVDLATDISYIERLVTPLKNGVSLTTGSRLMKDSKAVRPLSRDIASRSYNTFVRVLFGSRVYDHQCGFKGFKKKDIEPVLGYIRDNHWFWDTELLIVCQKLGLVVDEFPVTWKHNGGNNMNPSKVKVVHDSLYMGKRLIKLKIRQLMGGLCTTSVDEVSGARKKTI